MNRWKLVVGMTVGLALLGCEKPDVPDVIEPPDVVEPPDVDPDLDKAKALVAEGEKLLAEKKFDEAEAKANEALALKPELEEAKALLAKVKAEKAKLTDAQKAKIAAEKRKQIADRLNAANGLLDQGKLDEAEAEVKKVLKLDAENVAAKKLADQIRQARKDSDAQAKIAKSKADLKKKANNARARGDWVTAASIYKQLVALPGTRVEKATYLDRAAYCEARNEYDLGHKAERAGRLEEAEKRYRASLGHKPLPLAKTRLESVVEMRRQKARRDRDNRAFDEAMKAAEKLEAEDNLRGAIDALKPVLTRKVDSRKVLQASQMVKRLTKELNCREQKKAAEAALAEEPPNYAAAAQALVSYRDIKGELPADLQQTLIECKFQMALTRGDAAKDAGEYAEAIEAYEEALSYKEDEAVALKLEEVKDLKAVADFDAFVAKGDEFTAAEPPSHAEAVEAYRYAVSLADERPGAFLEKEKDVAGARSKLTKAEKALKKQRDAELNSKYKALMTEWKKVKKQPRAVIGLLEPEKATYESNKKLAGKLDKLLAGAKKSLDKSAAKEWKKVKKQVNRNKEDYESNIQLLQDCLEKVKGTASEQEVRDRLAAEEQAMKEAPPPPADETAPAEGAVTETPVETPVEVGEEPAPE